MNTVNPEMTTDTKSDNKKLLSDDRLREAYKDPKIFDDFSEEEKLEFHQRFIEGGEEGIPEEGETVPNQEPETSKKVEPEVEQKAKIESESEDIQTLKRKLKDERDLKNTLRQQLESTKKRLENLNELKIPEPPKVDNVYNEEAVKNYNYQKEVAEKQNKLLDEQRNYISREAEDLAVKAREVEISHVFTEISSVQMENPELRTSKPINVLDKAYANFRDTIAGRNASEEEKQDTIDKYLRDPEFRKKKEAEGYLFPIGEADWKNYSLIHQLNTYKKNHGYPDLDVAYYKYKKETGLIPDPIKQTALDTAQKVASQLGGTNETTIMSPDLGKTGSMSNTMSDKEIERWLIENPTPTTPEQKRVFSIIRKQLGMDEY